MIGICLNYQQPNYGSKLQALATIRMLERFGVEYEILRYNKRTVRFLIKSLPRFFNVVFLNDRYDQIQRTVEFRRHPKIREQVEGRNRLFAAFNAPFEEHLSEFYPSYEKLKEQCPQRYEAVLTCSDQLWSPSALGSGFYNLMFAPEQMPKISWASSFGVKQIPWYQVRRTRAYLNRIQRISMRENRGAEIVRELTGRTVPVLMDPVFALDREDWEKLVPPEKPEWERYIFCYFLGDNPEHRAAAQALAEKTGMKIVTIRHLDRYVACDEQFGDYAPYDVDPNRFLNILRGAAFVCTDSFHGSAFSILHEKEFVIFNRYDDRSSNSKNSRIDSLCENLGLQDRRARDADSVLRAWESRIDYPGVKEKLAQYRDQTLSYLEEAFGRPEELKKETGKWN